MKRERILFVYFEAGSGHRVVAEAVADAIRNSPSCHHDIQLLEFFRETGLTRIEFVTKSLYNNFLLKHPLLYALYYHLGDSPFVIKFLYKLFIDRGFWKSIDNLIEKHRPRMCVLVNPHLCECFHRVVSRKEQVPILVNLVSDPFSIHSLWLSPNADFNLVFSEEAKNTFLSKGIPESKIRSFGYPLHMKFKERVYCRWETHARYGFSPEKFTILIYAGGHNTQLAGNIMKKLAESRLPIQVFLILGKQRGKPRLTRQADWIQKQSVRIFGFTDAMAELMAVSDMVVCKAGPAIIFEAITMKKPMVLVDYVPGQEKGNVAYVLRNNYGWYCNRVDTLLHLLVKVLENRSILEKKRKALKRSSFSNGTPKIANFLINVLSETPPLLHGCDGEQLTKDR